MSSSLLAWVLSQIVLCPLEALAGDPRCELADTGSAWTPWIDACATDRASPSDATSTLAAEARSEFDATSLGLGPDEATHVGPDGAYPNLYRRASLSLGVAALANFHTSLQVSSDVLVGATLDLEDLLGVDGSATVARLDGHYSFNERHRIDFSYFDIQREGTKTIAAPIDVGQVTIPAGSVKTEFDTEIAKLDYRYNFVTDTRTVIGASAGIHLMGLHTAIRSPTFAVSETFRVDAPLPLIGLHGSYALSDRWTLSASIEVLQFDLGDYRGFVNDNRLTLDHDTFDHFGWGVGFNGFRTSAHAEGDNGLNADLEYGYQGLMIYLRTFF